MASTSRIEPTRLELVPDRTARRVLGELTSRGLLASTTDKGPVSLRFPASTVESLFPMLYSES